MNLRGNYDIIPVSKSKAESVRPLTASNHKANYWELSLMTEPKVTFPPVVCQESKICKNCGKAFFRRKKYSKKQWMSRAYCSSRCGAFKRDLSIDLKICGMYEDGDSCADIAVIFKTSATQIERIIKDNGMSCNPYKIKKGGIHLTSQGYLRFDDSAGNGYHAGRKIHTLIAEMMIGRPLKKCEVAHHLDGDKLNNHPKNLKVMSRGEHTTLHKKNKRGNTYA